MALKWEEVEDGFDFVKGDEVIILNYNRLSEYHQAGKETDYLFRSGCFRNLRGYVLEVFTDTFLGKKLAIVEIHFITACYRVIFETKDLERCLI